MTFQDIKTPEQLMTYLDQNFEYGVIDNNGNIIDVYIKEIIILQVFLIN